jgi:gliding motility-associated-like protein
MNTVHFEDFSSYIHEGGLSPFGSLESIATFSPQSIYYIKTNDGSAVLFSGKQYGHIKCENTIALSIPSFNTGANPFTFTSLTTYGQNVTFLGTSDDMIHVFGGEINAETGSINLHCGSMYLAGTNVIKGFQPVYFTLNGVTGSTVNLLTSLDTLLIENDLYIQSEDASPREITIDGLVDVKTNKINLSFINLTFSGSSILCTANPAGVEGSVQGGTLNYFETVTFHYNGTTSQLTGLANHTTPVGTMIVENQIEVLMDNSITVYNLKLYNGIFDIKNNTLNSIGFIENGLGYLGGNSDFSVLNINGIGSMDIFIPTELNLNKLTVNSQGITGLSSLGTLNVGTFELLYGEFYINECMMTVQGQFNVIGGLFNGGPAAGLTFGPALSQIYFYSPVDFLELGTLINYSAIPFLMPGNLSIWNLLDIGPSNFNMGGYALSLYGNYSCSGGVLETGMTSSSLVLGQGNTLIPNMSLYFSSTENILSSLFMERPGAIVDIATNIIISTELYMNGGKLRVLNSTIHFLPDCYVTTGNDTYIITALNGFVSREFTTTSTNPGFPVGTELFYAPVNIIDDYGTFYVSVRDSVFTSGSSGNVVTDTRIVNHTWSIDCSDQTNAYAVEFLLSPTNKGVDFIIDGAYLLNYDVGGSKWLTVPNSLVNTANISLTVNNMTLYGLFSISSGVNQVPIVATPQEFFVDERSIVGTLVGQLNVSDPDPGQILTANFVSPIDMNPFCLQTDLSIVVLDPLLLDFATHPSFTYNLDICDNGLPTFCKPLTVKINLNDIADTLSIANYLSPNNDNINDTWKIKGVEYIQVNVRVFNSFGNLVFASDSYQNEWDGTTNGQRLPPGVYYYKVFTPFSEYTGTLTLAR